MEQDAVCITKFVGWFKPMRSISNIGKCFSLVLPKMEKQSKLNTVNISNIHGLSLQNLPTLESTQQIREQTSGPDLLVFTLKFLALKNPGFSALENTSQICFAFCLPLFYATFQCRP